MTGPVVRERPFTAEERVRLERHLRELRSVRRDLVSAFVVFIVVLVVVAGVGHFLGYRKKEGALTAAGVAAGLAGAMFVRFRRRSVSPAMLKPLEDELRDGVVRETIYAVTDAIEVEPIEDEGRTYWLKLDDGRVLFLSGQYLDDDAEGDEDDHGQGPRFPNTRIVIASTARRLIDFRCEGGYFPPSTVLPHFPIDRVKRGDLPEDGDLLDADFETLRRGHAGAAP